MSQPNLNEDLNVIANSNIEITYMDGDLNIIQALDDEPNDVGGLSSAQLKAKFDEAGNTIKTYINETLIPEILAADATEAAREAAEAARETAEAARAAAEDDRITAEALRSSAETERQSAESNRAAAESDRATSEESRATAESKRAEAEQARVDAENLREQAETERAEAENARENLESGYVAQAKTQAGNAKAWAEGGPLTGDDGIGKDIVGAKFYRDVAKIYAEGGQYDPDPTDGTIETLYVSGSKNMADKAKAYTEGGTYQEYQRKASPPTVSLVETTVPAAESAKGYAADAKASRTAAEAARDEAKEERAHTMTLYLPTSGWEETAITQTVSVVGVKADGEGQSIEVWPHEESEEAYHDAGVSCISRDTDILTFKADSVPASSLKVQILMRTVEQKLRVTVSGSGQGYASVTVNGVSCTSGDELLVEPGTNIRCQVTGESSKYIKLNGVTVSDGTYSYTAKKNAAIYMAKSSINTTNASGQTSLKYYGRITITEYDDGLIRNYPISAIGPQGEPGPQGPKGDTGSDANVTAENIVSALGYKPASADNVNQLKQDITTITPDDTTVDGKPWTSKKIADSLCMPFEETGNPVKCYPVKNYPLGVKVSWEPTQEGSGDPSPDNIRPISGRDAVSVTRCGKNLLKPVNTNTENNGIKFTSNDDGTLTVNGTSSATAFYNINTQSNPMKIAEGDYVLIPGSDKVKMTVANNGTGTKYESTVGTNKTCHLPSGNYSVFIAVNAGTTIENAIVRPQIELGTTATPYEPYTGSTTDIALPETVYGGTLDVGTGVLTVDRALITADRSLFKLMSDGERSFYQYADEKKKYPMPYPVQSYLKQNTRCNVARIEEPYGNYSESAYQVFVIDDGRLRMSVAMYDSEADIKICYPIKDPYTIQLTPQQVTALSGVNTLYTDADGVVVTGAEDPKHTITELKNAIISLGGNI